MKKWFIIVGYLLVIFIGFINREQILHWIQENDKTHLPLMFLFSAIIATIPIIPFTLFSALMGAKYGLFTGSMINWFGSVAASFIYFLLARYFLTGFFNVHLKKFKGIDKFHQMIEKNGFIAIFIARIVPVIPPPVVNIYSGVTGMAFLTYISATAIGKVPPTLFVAYSGGYILSSLPKFFAGAAIYLIFLTIIILFYKTWFNRQSHIKLKKIQ
ncbi:TVP38/TMEM64 family protein [Peribacillus cavernae]|uniref:TVP38/TMEM64 family membrane protein n=1 Tax=Peribacillus cavernae TaxID=1674310 RepID=A0A433HW25_9BACI|nr:VTT domain-containing protein [Peribacillus cavernae]MDQ0217863.1 putative membrane protein YdjX (TVP38/TMEM64 family) [Peribacillus cavernae]RUQ32530.1 TVP38/TMEM64 family protein [Peribacillus cavernae]